MTNTTNAPSLMQKCAAEFLGTAFLVFIGTGAIAASGHLTRNAFGIADLLTVGIAFAFALALIFYAIGHISGAHVNPAVSVGLAAAGRFPWNDVGPYIVAQILGALLGSLGVILAFSHAAATAGQLGATTFNENFTSYFGAIVLEAIGTFVLLFVIRGVLDRRGQAGASGLAMGLALGSMTLVLGSVTGGSVNPARTIGPVVIQLLFGGSYPLSHLWVYIIGPLVGGVLGSLAYNYVAGMRALERPEQPARRFEVGGHD